MTHPDLVIRAPRAIVDGAEQAALVVVADGTITTVDTDPGALGLAPACARTVTLADDVVLLPGLVDTHVHVNEPGRTDWEGF
ncbi:MAG: allantoinase, partial [Dietzia sp.]